MQITFDTTTITDDEVRGIFALLDTVRPAAFDPGPFSAEGVAQAVEEKIANGGYVHTKETLPGPETVEAGQFTIAPSHDPSATDSNGFPWDERIHSSSKALNADGTWRTKRGVDKALVAEVEAELRQSQETRAEVDEPEASDESDPAGRIEVAQTVAPIELSMEQGGALAEAAQTVAPPAPPAPYSAQHTEQTTTSVPAPTPPPVIAPSSTVSPFVALMKRVTTAQGAGKLTQPRVKELLESLDKKSIMDLRTDEDALASFAVLLDGEGV